MKEEIESMVDDYIVWLKNRTILKDVGNKWIEITTPHLDRHNDCLQIYVKKEGHNFCLTDGGNTINDLHMLSCSLESPKQQKLLKTILTGFGVQLEKDELLVRASVEDFSLKKHNLVQAMLSINALNICSELV